VEQTRDEHSPLDDARDAVDRVNAKAGRNLPAAISVGLLLIAWVVLSLIYFIPGFVVLVIVCVVFGTIELHRALLVHDRGTSAIVPVAIGGALTSIGAYFAAGRTAEDAILFILAPMALTSVVALGWRLRGGPVNYVRDASSSLLGIAYVTLMGAFLPLAAGESHGNLRIAAMILCVVASDVGALAEVVGRDGRAGVLVPAGDAEALAAAIRALLGDPTLRVATGMAGRERVLERYSWAATAQATVDLYRTAIADAATEEVAEGLPVASC